MRLGQSLHGMARELYPICRSISGHGLRETLTRIESAAGIKSSFALKQVKYSTALPLDRSAVPGTAGRGDDVAPGARSGQGTGAQAGPRSRRGAKAR